MIFLRDLRYGLRILGSNRGFALAALAVMTLGVGVSTAIFSVLHGVLLTPLSYPHAERLILFRADAPGYVHEAALTADELSAIRERSDLFASVAVINPSEGNLTSPDEMAAVTAASVSENFFETLRVRPLLGRSVSYADAAHEWVAAVDISYEAWQRHFHGDPNIVGRRIEVNNRPMAVAGVLPPAFRLYLGPGVTVATSIDIWYPRARGYDRDPFRGHIVIARLKDGVSVEHARAAVSALAADLVARHPSAYAAGPVRLSLETLDAEVVKDVKPALTAIAGAVAFVLLIACANLANLLLSRASARRREFAVRLSLGCRRSRLVRQLLTESIVLVSFASIAALLAQLWTSGLLNAIVPPNDLPIKLLTPSVDIRVIGFVAIAALASVILFGLAPALQAGRTDLVIALRNDSAQAGAQRSWLRNTLVVSQVAFTMLLLASAGLFAHSMTNAHQFDVGFRTDHMLLGSVNLFSSRYDRTRGTQALTEILDGIRALPGVDSVTLARRVPLGISTGSSSTSLEPEGYVAPKDQEAFAYLNWVGPDYFHTMGIPLISGREFARTDSPNQTEVFVVNRSFATRYWPGQEAIGKRVRLGKDWYNVVGVVADSKYRKLNEPPAPFVYLSTTWNYRPDVTFQIRTTSAPELLAGPMRDVVKRVDPKLPVFGVMTLADQIRSASFQQRLAAMVLMVFGALALLLASIGLYATMSYAVARRTRELGARLAMGATRGDITRLVLGQALRLTAIGLLIGIVLGAGAAQAFKSLLLGVPPLDVITFGGVTALLAGIAGIASYVPARRASRLDPLKALRYE